MNIKKALIFTALAFLFQSDPAQATSLDEIYRDIVRSDNRGYLPMFVKNRNVPDFLLEDEALKKYQQQEEVKKEDIKPVNLVNERKLREAELLARQQNWLNILAAVKTGRITPSDLEEIKKRVDNSDPQATEIYAWMNARGIGISTDLIKAFNLYQKAEKLQVPNAALNAAKVYRAMKPEQRQSLNSFKN